jgi:hypothetical protein
MHIKYPRITGIFTVTVLVMVGCQPEQISLWKRHCDSCHKGKTSFKDRTVMNKEHLTAKYETIEQLLEACETSPSCMNILKHNKKLLREVGKEIGLKENTS